MNNNIENINFDPNKPQKISEKGVIIKVPRTLIEEVQRKKDLKNAKKRVLTKPNFSNNRGYVVSTVLIVSSIILLSIIIFVGISNILGK